MRHLVLIILLICWICSGSSMAFGKEHKGHMEEYQNQTEAKLKGIRKDLQELQGKAVNLKDDARHKFHKDMKELKQKQDRAHMKLKELKSATDQTWGTIKTDTDGAVNDLSRHFDGMKAWFRKQ
jgi:septal ring factor EnvC (AmiA/AmiB activator)